MSETTQLIIGIAIFVIVICMCISGRTSEPNLTDQSNCYAVGTEYICN